ncbi:serine/threonine-protein kinase [Cystobacter ferrugineus]|nr:serine/threonine-protein kinase [Cystobacter ferrugineus]
MTQPAASDVRVGSVLRDTYELTSLLGKGGMGAVYLASHRRLPGRQVAVKVLRGGADLSPEQYARFRREAEIASRLGHPNIVEVLDFNTLEDGTPFLVMEYLRGESLEQRLERGPLVLEEMMFFTRQIGSGLAAAHRAGVVHRDLKPANVLLVPTDFGGTVRERVKLLDFGVSKMLASQTLQTQDSVLLGTPQYMAPEQAMGRNSEVDARADLFALGCIVYEMLSGRSPFEGEENGIHQVLFRIVHTQPEPLVLLHPGLPEHVLSAVERALAKSAGDRHADVTAFIQELTGKPLLSLSRTAMPRVFVPSNPRMAAVAAGTSRFSMDGQGVEPTHVPARTVRAGASVPPGSASAPLGIPPGEIRGARPVPKWVVGMGWALLVGLAAAAWWMMRSPPPIPPMAPVAPSAATVVSGDTARKGPSSEHAASPVLALAPPASPVATVALYPPTPPSAPAKPSAPVRPPLPEPLRRQLAEAERALTAGDRQEAIRLARLSQRTQLTAESFVVMIRAFCGQGDLANANAKWREGRSRLSPEELATVRRDCEKHEIEF